MVSNGSVPGENVWMQWRDPNPLDVTDIACMTGFRSTGKWKFEVKDASDGLTPDPTGVSLTLYSPSGVLGFTCAANATGTKLDYILSGADWYNFQLSSESCTVTI